MKSVVLVLIMGERTAELNVTKISATHACYNYTKSGQNKFLCNKFCQQLLLSYLNTNVLNVKPFVPTSFIPAALSRIIPDLFK